MLQELCEAKQNSHMGNLSSTLSNVVTLLEYCILWKAEAWYLCLCYIFYLTEVSPTSLHMCDWRISRVSFCGWNCEKPFQS